MRVKISKVFDYEVPGAKSLTVLAFVPSGDDYITVTRDQAAAIVAAGAGEYDAESAKKAATNAN